MERFAATILPKQLTGVTLLIFYYLDFLAQTQPEKHHTTERQRQKQLQPLITLGVPVYM